jgi:hypothetical protein
MLEVQVHMPTILAQTSTQAHTKVRNTQGLLNYTGVVAVTDAELSFADQ